MNPYLWEQVYLFVGVGSIKAKVYHLLSLMFLINKIPKNLMYFLPLLSEPHCYFTKAEAQALKISVLKSIGEIPAVLEQECMDAHQIFFSLTVCAVFFCHSPTSASVGDQHSQSFGSMCAE